jgi:hypothetical protein
MSFWGMSNAGREAGGFARESGAWNFQQFKDWLDQMNRFGNQANFYQDLFATHNTGKMNEGWRNPTQIRQQGQQISPWVQQAIDAANARLQTMLEQENGMPTGNDTANTMSGRLDEVAGGITRNFDDVQGDINGTAGRSFERQENLNRDVVNNIRDTSASMRGAVNDTFSGLRRDNAATAARAMDLGRGTFSENLRSLELLRPGGTAQTARVARSFAPNIADTMTRLRRSGIDPNSPQAASALRQVETSRARAMDDASAQATTGYVDRGNALRTQELGFLTDVDRDRLRTEADLGIGQVDRSNQISGNEGEQFRQEQRRFTGAQQGIDEGRRDLSIGNLNRTSDQSNALQLQRMNLDLQRRGMTQEDADRISRILMQMTDQDFQNGQALDNQFAQGNNWYLLDQSTRDQGANALNQLAQSNRNSQFQAANTAQGFNSQAGQNYNTAFQRESQNAGWGTRLLGGIAQAGLSMIPGMAPVAGLIGGATQRPNSAGSGAGGAGGPAGRFGGGAGPNGSFSFSDAQGGIGALADMFRNSSYQPALANGRWAPTWNPNRSRTLPNGDFQVGR